MFNRNSLRFQTKNLADTTDTILFSQTGNAANIMTHQRFIDAWTASLRTRYDEDARVLRNAGITVDARAAERAFHLVVELKFCPGFPDVEIQADEDGGAALVVDALSRLRRLIVEIDPDGSTGNLKLVGAKDVYKKSVSFSEPVSWMQDCLIWLEQD